MSMLHVTNGDSARIGPRALRRAGHLHRLARHPARRAHPGSSTRGVDESGAIDLPGVDTARQPATLADGITAARRDDAALERGVSHDEVVLWFEHDLYDQLLLIRHLWWLARRRRSSVLSHSSAARHGIWAC